MTQGLVVALAVLLILFVLLTPRRKKSVPEAPYVSKRIPELSRWEPEVPHVPKRIPELSRWEPKVPHVPKQIGPVSPVSWWDVTKYGVGSGVLLGGAGWAYLLWLEDQTRKRQRAERRRAALEEYRRSMEQEIPRRPEQLARFQRDHAELMATW
jgi:hypothetical protein